MNISECKEGMVVLCHLKKLGVCYLGVISGILNNCVFLEGCEPAVIAVSPDSLTEQSLDNTEQFKRSIQHEILLGKNNEFELEKLKQLKDKIQKRIEEMYVEMGITIKERSINEILKQAESTKDLQSLITLWNEIAFNKKKYALVDIVSANEKLRELALKSNGSDIEIGEFYNFLRSQKDQFDSRKIEVISIRRFV
jgi:ribosomal protein S6